jgi:hypothetical protein
MAAAVVMPVVAAVVPVATVMVMTIIADMHDNARFRGRNSDGGHTHAEGECRGNNQRLHVETPFKTDVETPHNAELTTEGNFRSTANLCWRRML